MDNTKEILSIDEFVGANVKRIRESEGLSQAQLAKKTGLTTVSISRIENGQQARRSNLRSIAKELGCKIEDFFRDYAPNGEKTSRIDYDLKYAADVLSRLQDLPPGPREFVLAVIFRDRSRAESLVLDLNKFFPAQAKAQK